MKCPIENCNAELIRDEVLSEQREEDRQGEVLTEYVILRCPRCKKKFEVTATYRVSYELIDCYYGNEIDSKKEKKESEISKVVEEENVEGIIDISFDGDTEE